MLRIIQCPVCLDDVLQDHNIIKTHYLERRDVTKGLVISRCSASGRVMIEKEEDDNQKVS